MSFNRNFKICIQCCKTCVPPQRHVGCHATCPEYLEQKRQNEESRKLYIESKKAEWDQVKIGVKRKDRYMKNHRC